MIFWLIVAGALVLFVAMVALRALYILGKLNARADEAAARHFGKERTDGTTDGGRQGE